MLSEVAQAILFMVILDRLMWTGTDYWLENWIDVMSVHATLFHRGGGSLPWAERVKSHLAFTSRVEIG